ncbi:MAG: S8/S53 family peptidase [Roseibacillus sp.]
MFRHLLFLLALSISSLLGSEIVDWNFALNSGGSTSQAIFTAVEAPRSSPHDEAFAGGHFEGVIVLPGLSGNLSSSVPGGLVVKLSPNTSGGWLTQWAATTSSNGSVLISDLVLTEDTGLIYVCGSYEDEVFFDPSQTISLPAPTDSEGFVAILDQATGSWISATSLGSFIPRSIAVDSNDSMYLTGPSKLVMKRDNNGIFLWDINANTDTITLEHIATQSLINGQAKSFVLSTVLDSTGSNGSDIRISAISETGTLLWEKFASSSEDEVAGGLGVSPQGLISFSLSTTNAQVSYEGSLLDAQSSPLTIQESYLVRIQSDGNYLWSTRIAAGDAATSTMTSTDLAHDPMGNVHLAVNFNGPFTFEGKQRVGNKDTGILSVGDGGLPYRFLTSSGGSIAKAQGISAPLREEQVIVGNQQDSGDLIFGSDILPGGSTHLFAAFTKNLPLQAAYIIHQTPDDPTPSAQFLANLKSVLQGEQGTIPQLSTPAEIYHEFDYPDLIPGAGGIDIGVVGYAAFISDQDIDLIEASNLYEVDRDILIRTSGTVSPSSQNLANLNDASAASPYSYSYPEMCQPVRLYLIDTAVTDPGGSYFSSNSHLNILDPLVGGYGELIRSGAEPHSIITSEHGTNLLSLVAGPNEGAAQHTPITTKVYDIYPSLGGTRASALVKALNEARVDRTSSQNLYTPAVILIASNSVSLVDSDDLDALNNSINACLTVNMPIIMSAGNEGGLAADYAPSQLGTTPGVLCVGSSDLSGGFLGISNSGPALRALAPGKNTVVATEVLGLQTTKLFTGTSASAALAAGSFIQFHSANPWLSPIDLTNDFITHSTHTTTIEHGGISYPQVKADSIYPGCYTSYDDWTSWFLLTNVSESDNDDGDPYSNLEEYVHGLDPTFPEGHPHLFQITDYSSPDLTMGFPVAWWLWDSTATAGIDKKYLLRDGSTKLWIGGSEDLASFDSHDVSFFTENDCGVQSDLSFTIDVTSPAKEFFRVESETSP